MADKWQLHISQVGTVEMCGERYRRRYVEGEIIPPGIAAISGSGAHAGVSTDLRRKIETGELAPLEEIQDVTRDYVAQEFDRGAYRMSPNEQAAGAQSVRDEAVDWAVRYTRAHHKLLAPKITPVRVERPWVIRLQGYPCDLAGRIDVQEQTNGRLSVRDLKTGGRVKDPAASEQLTTYALALKVLDHAEPPIPVWLDNVVQHQKNGKKTCEVLPLGSERGDEDFKALLRRIEAAVRLIEAGTFIPTSRQHSWWCDPKWCGYWHTCPYVRERKVFLFNGGKA